MTVKSTARRGRPSEESTIVTEKFKSVSKYLAVATAIVVALAYMGLFVIGSWAEARVENKIAQLRASGQPIDLEDLKREPIPPEDDAATYLRQAKSDLESIYQTLDSLDEVDKEQLDSRNYLTPKAKEAFGRVIAEHANVFPLLERAAECADLNPVLSLDEGQDAFYESFGRNADLVRYANAALRCRACSATTIPSLERQLEFPSKNQRRGGPFCGA